MFSCKFQTKIYIITITLASLTGCGSHQNKPEPVLVQPEQELEIPVDPIQAFLLGFKTQIRKNKP